MKSKKLSLSKKIKLADKLFSELVRSRGKCEHCGKTTSLQCAHIISRTNKHLRWNEDNALSLCVRCHLYWSHRNPLEFTKWYQENYPVNYLFLMREKDKIEPELGQTIEFIIKELREKLK